MQHLVVLCLQVLKTEWLRQQANEMAYVDPALANRDAMLVGRLNTHMPGAAPLQNLRMPAEG